MSTDGKALEELVSHIEKQMLPDGFTVKSNVREYTEDGTQLAEFDIVVSGKLGSTAISWLIECRDRPGSGPAPGSWIEQLAHRRQRFGFSRVTAVSTSGFSANAFDCAKSAHIELREVANLSPEGFRDWLFIESVTVLRFIFDLKHVTFVPSPEMSEQLRETLKTALSSVDGNLAFLRSAITGSKVRPADAFTHLASSVDSLKQGLTPQSPPRPVHLKACWPNDDYFVIDTQHGEVRIAEAYFDGEVRADVAHAPITTSREYRNVQTGETIAQVVSFDGEALPIGIELRYVPYKGIFVVAKGKETGQKPSPDSISE
jgi:hypothetical protein